MGRTPPGVIPQYRLLAYRSLDITYEQVAMAPQITPELRAIGETMRHAGQPRIIRKRTVTNPHDATERVSHDVIQEEHTLPYGPESDLTKSWPLYLQSSEHPDARKVLLAYHSLTHSMRLACPVEAFCVAAGVGPLSILGIITGEIVRRGAQARNIIAMANQPRVVQKMVDVALTDGGFEDRQLLAKATGFLPAAKGAQISIHTSANASSQAATPVAIVAPAPEQTTRRLATKLNEMRGLPAAPTEPQVIDIPAREAITVDAVDADYDSSDDDE